MRKFVDMAFTRAEAKLEAEPSPAEVSAAAPRYSYGLCICLGPDELAKLGITDMPSAGDMLHGAFMSKVTSVSERDTEGGKDCRVELQITHLAIESEDDENDEMVSERRAKRMYVGAKDDED